MVFGAIPATLLWVINNRRLGFVQSKSTFVSVFAGLAVYILIGVHLLLIEEQNAQYWIFRFLGSLITLVLAWRLFLSQLASFARHHHSGGRTAFFWTPLLVGILCLGFPAVGELGAESVRTERDYREFDRMVGVLNKNDDSTNAQVESFFSSFKRKYPNEKLTYWNLALLYDRTNRVEKAKQELRQLLKLEPNNKEVRTYLKQLEEE